MIFISSSDPRIKLYEKLYGVDADEAKRILERKEEEKELLNKSDNNTKCMTKDKESLDLLNTQANMNMFLVHKNKKDINN